MITMAEVTIEKNWTTFRDVIINSKNVPFQEDDSDSEAYELYAPEQGVMWYCRILRDGGSDVTEYESDYQAGANKPISKRSLDDVPYTKQTPATIGTSMRIEGGEFLATANSKTTGSIKFDSNIEIVGCMFYAENGGSGDKVNVYLIDKDDILGYGTDTVLTNFATDVPARIASAVPVIAESSGSDLINQGLYIEIEYDNSNASDVKVEYAFKYYK